MQFQNDIKKIHECSLKILEEIGIKIHCETTLEMLKQHNFKIEGNIVYMNNNQISKALETVKSSFTVKGRNEKYSLNIGMDSREYASGYGCAAVVDSNGVARDATRKDYLDFAKIIEGCDLFNVNGGILVQPCELNATDAPLVLLNDLINHSEKALMTVPNDGNSMKSIMEMLEILYGKDDLTKNHRAITLINTTSPLAIDSKALETLEQCAKYNQPVVITPAPMCGTTGPILYAGSLAQGNAEILATIVIAQLLKPGMPLVYGVMVTPVNMQNAACSLGSPAYNIVQKYASALGHFYNMPVRNGGAPCDANMVGFQSGYEGAFGLLTSSMNGSNLLIHSAGILNSFEYMSFEKFICDIELINRMEYYYKGIEVNDETLLFDEIKAVGHDGHFLLEESTLNYSRNYPWYNKIGTNAHLEQNEKYSGIVSNNIQAQLEKALNGYKKPSLEEGVRKSLNNYVNNKCSKNYF